MFNERQSYVGLPACPDREHRLIHLVIGTGGTKGHDDVYQTGTAGEPTETINVSGTATETEDAPWSAVTDPNTTYPFCWCPGGGDQRRLNVTWVTPLGLLVASIRKWSSSASSPSHSRSPRPSTMGTTTTCR